MKIIDFIDDHAFAIAMIMSVLSLLLSGISLGMNLR